MFVFALPEHIPTYIDSNQFRLQLLPIQTELTLPNLMTLHLMLLLIHVFLVHKAANDVWVLKHALTA